MPRRSRRHSQAIRRGLPTAPPRGARCARSTTRHDLGEALRRSAPPAISSLADLEALLGLTVAPNPNNDRTPTERQGHAQRRIDRPRLRAVTALNPRAF